MQKFYQFIAIFFINFVLLFFILQIIYIYISFNKIRIFIIILYDKNLFSEASEVK
jgi:hypothetical protein